MLAGAGVVVILLAAVVVMLYLLLGSGDHESVVNVTPSVAALAAENPTATPTEVTITPTASVTPMPTFTPLVLPTATLTPKATATAAPTFTPFASPTAFPTLTPAPTLTPIVLAGSRSGYALLIAKNKDDSLFVVNQSAEDFPLPLLSLGEGKNAISGTDWQVDLLAPGECVSAWKDTGRPKAPDVTCTEVGSRLIRKNKERFWKSAFPVYFRGERITQCKKESCLIEIAE